MSPPLPPSPPSGPPYSIYFSRRKLTAPGPPAPERTKILAWSRKCMAWALGAGAGLRQPGGGDELARRQLARFLGGQAEGAGHRLAEERIAEGGEDEPEGELGDRPVLMALAEAIDETVDRFEHRIERVAVAGEDHPRGERAGAFPAERVEGAVDHLARVRLALPRARDGMADAGSDPLSYVAGERRLQPGRRAEMVEQVGV